MTDAIKIKNLSKSFGNFRLGPVDLGIKKGTITGFIGENGAGKSTTIKLILDVIARDNGAIEIFGKDIKNLSVDEKYKLGFVYDDLFLPGSMKVDEIEKMHSLLYKDHWEKGTFYEFMENFALPTNIPIKTFSRGMKMKLGLALSMSHGAEILILDEPTSGLDPAMRDELVDMILDFMEDPDHTVLFSTHITQDLDRIADYIVFTDQGKIVFEGPKDEFYDKFLLIKGGLDDFEKIKNFKVYGQKKSKVNFEALVLREDYKEDDNLVAEVPGIDQIMIYYGRI